MVKVSRIFVSPLVREVLDHIKERDGHSSFDSVIRDLAHKAGEYPIKKEQVKVVEVNPVGSNPENVEDKKSRYYGLGHRKRRYGATYFP